MRRSTQARNLHSSPAVAHGESASWHCFCTSLVGASAQICRWYAATSVRHFARMQEPAEHDFDPSVLHVFPSTTASGQAQMKSSPTLAQSASFLQLLSLISPDL